LGYGRSTFSVSLEGVTDKEAASIHEFRTTIAMARMRQATHSSYEAICIARLPRTTRSTTNDPQRPYPTRRPFCESATADKVMRNDRWAAEEPGAQRLWVKRRSARSEERRGRNGCKVDDGKGMSSRTLVARRPTRMIHPRTTSDSRPASSKSIAPIANAWFHRKVRHLWVGG
jgi:hypothetical protein